jgi:5-amino-6-(5-phosphoribosylamino)uracil reductase
VPRDVVTYRRLLPECTDEIGADALLDELFAGLTTPADKPYTLVNFVASVDGRATVKGRSGGLGDAGDHALFHGLRERADAVLAGAVTMQAEKYGRILGKAERRRRRLERGQSAEPLACLLTRSGHVPTAIPLFGEPDARIVVFAGKVPGLRQALDDCPAQIELAELAPDQLTMTTALHRLHADYGVRTLLCEGGPTVFGALLAEGLADELFVTVAPKLTGGGHGPTITNGPELADPARLHLRWLLEHDESLFARYAIGYQSAVLADST